MNRGARPRTFHSPGSADTLDSGAVFPFPSAADVFAAAARVRGVVRRTPLERSAWLSGIAGTDLHLKLENLQRTGSFKLRG
ncbi:MAG TPA: hypothetical protein VGB66_04020, partial [Longimicrobium sp.]